MKNFEDYESLYNAYNYYHSHYDDNYESQSIIRREKKNVQVKTGFKFAEYDWHDEDMIKLIKCKQKYVTEGIGLDHLNWKYGDHILLSAQTGSGKNFWVESVLIPYCIKFNLRIIIIVNRTALARQTKLRVAEKQKIKLHKDLRNRELDEREIFGCVTIKTYQKMIAEIKNLKIVDTHDPNFIDKDYAFCIMDEAHYYVSDSLFSSQTYNLMKALRKYFTHCIIIYSTSTPNEVVPWIIKVEKELPIIEIGYRITNPVIANLYPIKMKCFEFKRDYSHVVTRYFCDITEIIEKISADKSGEKWLIYVKNKEEGNMLEKKLGDKAVFIEASSKEENGLNHETYEEIIKNQKFNKLILCTTTVLDNGVNIFDPMLKNIVIMTNDETTFIQTLGRKRITKKGEKITLYIQNRTKTQIEGSIFKIKEKLNAYDLFKESDFSFRDKYLTGNPEGYKSICNLFHFKNKNEIEWNPIAIKKLKNDKMHLEKIKEKIIAGDVDQFIKEQLSWIGLRKTFDIKNYIDNKQKEDYINELLAFIESIIDKRLNKEEQEKLTWDFKDKCIMAYGKRKGKDNNNIDRNNRGYGIDVIKSVLEERNLPYQISSSDGFWMFEKKII